MCLVWCCVVACAVGDQVYYSCVVDSGSTGNRLYLYRITSAFRFRDGFDELSSRKLGSKENPWHFEMAKETKNKKPLAKAESAQEALSDLMDKAKSWLAKLGVDVAKTPIYLGATGGVRKLPARRVAKIMASVEEYLGQSGFRYKKDFGRMLSGEEEGAFAWAAVEYLRRGENEDIGALDLGGASTQIAAKEDDILEGLFVLNAQPYHTERLFARSFLYFGADGYADQLYDHLVDKASRQKKKKLKSKCYREYKQPCLPRGYGKELIRDGKVYCFNGTSNPGDCDKLTGEVMLPLLPPKVPCMQGSQDTNQCSLHGSYIPEFLPRKRFLAFNAFFHLWKFYDQTTEGTVNSILSKSVSICGYDHDSLKKYAAERDALNEHLYTRCLLTYYVKYLLGNAYHFDLDKTLIQAVDKIENVSASWALGLAIYQNYWFQVDKRFD